MMDDFPWTRSEKPIARKAFDNAYQSECWTIIGTARGDSKASALLVQVNDMRRNRVAVSCQAHSEFTEVEYCDPLSGAARTPPANPPALHS